MINKIIHHIYLFIMALCAMLGLIVAQGCGKPSSAEINASVTDAEEAVRSDHQEAAAKICRQLVEEHFSTLSEDELGRLAIVYMKLSESENYDENVAEATQCFRQAWKLSTDSMRGFTASLSPEDLPHFEMLRRLSASIDRRPDLMEAQEPDSLYVVPDSVK